MEGELQFEPCKTYLRKEIDSWIQLKECRERGYANDRQEAVEGFFCVAAPVFNYGSQVIAAVSFTMLESVWKEKGQIASKEIVNLADRLSRRAGSAKI